MAWLDMTSKTAEKQLNFCKLGTSPSTNMAMVVVFNLILHVTLTGAYTTLENSRCPLFNDLPAQLNNSLNVKRF